MKSDFHYDEIVIGGSLSALLYSYIHGLPIIINKTIIPYRFQKLGNVCQADLWHNLCFLLSLSGLNLVKDDAALVRINENILTVSMKNASILKCQFKEAIIFDDEDIFGLPISIEDMCKADYKHLVVDWITAKCCMEHEVDYLQTEDDFVKEIYFYPTERLTGLHPNKKDLVAVSYLTKKQVQDTDYSDTYARFKTYDIMKKNNITGRKNGFFNGKQINYDLQLEVEARDVSKLRMDLYHDTEKLKFNYKTPGELYAQLLSNKKQKGYQFKLNRVLNLL